MVRIEDMKKLCTFLVLYLNFLLPAFGINAKIDDFWSNFNDDNLRYFVSRAYEANYDLKIAAENSEIYKNYITSARANQLPSLSAGFTPSYMKAQGGSKYDWSFIMPLSVNYEADIFLKNRDKTKLSKKDYEMSLQDERAQHISVASAVGATYFNILKSNKMIELQKEILDLRVESKRLSEIANKTGVISLQDVILAKQAIQEAKAELFDLEKENERYVNELSLLLGTTSEENKNFIYSDIEKTNFEGNIPNSLNSSVIVSRPDYKKAELAVERAGIDIRVAKKEFLPSINLTGLSLFRAGEFSSLLTTKNALFGLLGGISQDLFTGGAKFANLKIKKSEYKIALQNYEKTNLMAIKELNDALALIKYDGEKYGENLKRNELENEDYTAYKARFEQGNVNKLDLIKAREELLLAKRDLLINKADCFINYIGLYKALGGDFTES